MEEQKVGHLYCENIIAGHNSQTERPSLEKDRSQQPNASISVICSAGKK